MQRRHPTAEAIDAEPERKAPFWAHDVLFALALTVMAIGFISVAWISGGTRPTPMSQSTVVTTK